MNKVDLEIDEPADNNIRAIYPCEESEILDDKAYAKLMKKMSGT